GCARRAAASTSVLRVWTISAAWTIISAIMMIRTATIGNSATAEPCSSRSRRHPRAPWPGRGPRASGIGAARSALLCSRPLSMTVRSEAAAEERRHRVLEDLHDLLRGDRPERDHDPCGHERDQHPPGDITLVRCGAGDHPLHDGGPLRCPALTAERATPRTAAEPGTVNSQRRHLGECAGAVPGMVRRSDTDRTKGRDGRGTGEITS